MKGICWACEQRPIKKDYAFFCQACGWQVELATQAAQRKSGGSLLPGEYRRICRAFCELRLEFVGTTDAYTPETYDRVRSFVEGRAMSAERDYKEFQREVAEKDKRGRRRAREIDLSLAASRDSIEWHARNREALSKAYDKGITPAGSNDS